MDEPALGWSSSVGISMVRDPFSFSLPLRFVRPLVVPLMPFLWTSSNGSSRSSFLVRLLRLELLDEGSGGRGGLSFGLGAVSVVGEPVGDLLVEVEGTERRPERRGSLGEGGGPIVATLAIAADVKKGVGRTRNGRRGKQRTGPRVPDNYWISG